MLFEFIELPPFAAVREELFVDEASFAAFQMYLCHHPQAGDVIPGTDGCRKIRWAAKGKSKRDDVPRAWLRKLKEVFDHEQGKKTRS